MFMHVELYQYDQLVRLGPLDRKQAHDLIDDSLVLRFLLLLSTPVP